MEKLNLKKIKSTQRTQSKKSLNISNSSSIDNTSPKKLGYDFDTTPTSASGDYSFTKAAQLSSKKLEELFEKKMSFGTACDSPSLLKAH